MRQNFRKIKSFTDLNVWKKGYKLVLFIYRITKDFPREKHYGLIDQLRQAVVSLTSNIAEGFSRISYKEKIQFYYRSLGSLTEVQNQLLIEKDLGYITSKNFKKLTDLTV